MNVKALQSEERLTELEHALQIIKLDIICLCEIRRMGEVILEKASRNLFACIGETKEQRKVGFIISNTLENCIEEFQGVSERIAVLN